MNAPVKPFAWSYSALTNFETCAKKYYHQTVAKDVKEEDSEERTWGYEVHSAMQRALDGLRTLPPEMKKFEKWLTWAREPYHRDQTILKTEERLAITNKLQPCDYFDKRVDPWLRVVCDVLKINGEVARVIDWKTGNSKTYLDKDTNTWKTLDSLQLLLNAAVVFTHYPLVQVIKAQYVWLKEDFHTEDTITRADITPMWQHVIPRLTLMHAAVRKGEFPAKPSGLCKKYCAVKQCAYHGKGSF